MATYFAEVIFRESYGLMSSTLQHRVLYTGWVLGDVETLEYCLQIQRRDVSCLRESVTEIRDGRRTTDLAQFVDTQLLRI